MECAFVPPFTGHHVLKPFDKTVCSSISMILGQGDGPLSGLPHPAMQVGGNKSRTMALWLRRRIGAQGVASQHGSGWPCLADRMAEAPVHLGESDWQHRSLAVASRSNAQRVWSRIPHRVQVVFWISYHSVLTNLQRPFLNPFDPSMAHNVPAVFRSATASAMAISRLLRALQTTDEIKYLPPFAVQHILRCALVHGLSILAVEELGGQRISSGNFWLCFRVLGELSIIWKELSENTTPFALMATRSWGFEVDVVPGMEEADDEKCIVDDGYSGIEDFGTGLGMSDDFFGAVGVTGFES